MYMYMIIFNMINMNDFIRVKHSDFDNNDYD